MTSDRPQCTATWEIEGRGVVRCVLPVGPHDDPQLGAYHQAPAEFPGGLTLWHDRATGATPVARNTTPTIREELIIVSSFKKGDRVVVVAVGPENAGTVGKTGTVFYTEAEAEADGEVAVKGIDGRIAEAVKGYRTYTPDQLRRA